MIDGLENAALAAAVDRVDELAGRTRYESAARLRDLTAAAVEVLWRGQRLRALAGGIELVAAAPDGAGGWQLTVVRHGQLAAAGCAHRGRTADAGGRALRTGAQVVLPRPAPLGGALVEETSLIARWLRSRESGSSVPQRVSHHPILRRPVAALGRDGTIGAICGVRAVG